MGLSSGSSPDGRVGGQAFFCPLAFSPISLPKIILSQMFALTPLRLFGAKA